jgi:C1A family cysteine protease
MGRMEDTQTKGPLAELETSNLTDSVDWRTKGAVNDIQDQGKCGSCWAFSSTAAMEGAHFLASGKLLKLSEQQFVDCAPTSYGCQGGFETGAFSYALIHPQELETAYPYTAKTGSCHDDDTQGKVSVETYETVPPSSDSQLKAAIQAQPTCVAVQANNPSFLHYSGGIINDPNCGTKLNHAITAIGYGSENGQEYYLIRNSWSTDWGEKGYVRIAAGKDGDGICGVLLSSSRPTTN